MGSTRWTSLFLAVTLVLLTLAPATAQAPALGLKATPGTLRLSPNEEATVLISATNPLTAALQDVRLTFSKDPFVEINLSAPPADTMLPQVSYAWQVRVKALAPFPDPRTITARLDYVFKTDANPQTPGIAIATFDIQPRAVETADKVAQLRLETAFDLVQENRPGMAYLVITNIADVPITLKQITFEHSESVAVIAPSQVSNRVLAPQVSVTLPYTITAASRIQPGKSTVLFHADFEWQRGAQVSLGTLHAATKFDVGVFGESALTAVFGVPSFLLLPGLLILVMLRAARGFVKKPLALEIKSPEFWVWAVLISIGVAVLYPILMAFFFHLNRNYLTSYGLLDVLVIWFGSLGVGLVGGMVWHLGEWLMGWGERKWFLPQPGDSPRQVLQKLKRRRAGIALPYATVWQGARAQRCVVISQDPLTKNYLVAPLARYTWLAHPSNELLDAFDRELERAHSAGNILELVERVGATLKLEWEQTDAAIKKPTYVPAASVMRESADRCRLLAENKKGSPPASLPQQGGSAP